MPDPLPPAATVIAPLLRLLAAPRQDLAAHLSDYAELAAADAGAAAAAWRRRSLLLGATVLCLLLAAGLGGMALLLVAVLPLSAMPQPWLLAVVPAVPLLAALTCALMLWRQPVQAPFAQLRQRLADEGSRLAATPAAGAALPAGALRPVLRALRRSTRQAPLLTLLAAAGAGAALVATRPWRWPLFSRLCAPWPGQLGGWLLQQLAQPATQALLGSWLLNAMAAVRDALPEETSAADLDRHRRPTVPPGTAS
ncbi:hypothetical protein [Aquabacterium sp.]|uniref:hypothetical protein n=1 Tax=Aquabacterium sp. TaxID=1872578 RepID=UPI0037847E81